MLLTTEVLISKEERGSLNMSFETFIYLTIRAYKNYFPLDAILIQTIFLSSQ